MPYKFFDNLLESRRAEDEAEAHLPVSIGIHVVVLAAVLVVPLFTFDDLPGPYDEQRNPRLPRGAGAAPPPPPPPPPPPAAAAPKAVTPPKVEQPKPVVEEPKFTAPVETPKEVPKTGGGDRRRWRVRGRDGRRRRHRGRGRGRYRGRRGGRHPRRRRRRRVGGVGGIPGRAPPPPPAPDGPVRVGGKISEPRKTNNVPPVYPEMAKHARVQGTVILEATISPQGRVADVQGAARDSHARRRGRERGSSGRTRRPC